MGAARGDSLPPLRGSAWPMEKTPILWSASGRSRLHAPDVEAPLVGARNADAPSTVTPRPQAEDSPLRNSHASCGSPCKGWKEDPRRLRRLGALCHSEAAGRGVSLAQFTCLLWEPVQGMEGDSLSPSAPRSVMSLRGRRPRILPCAIHMPPAGARARDGRRFFVAFGASERYVTPRPQAEEPPLRNSHAS
jgi:hypothetical protein